MNQIAQVRAVGGAAFQGTPENHDAGRTSGGGVDGSRQRHPLQQCPVEGGAGHVLHPDIDSDQGIRTGLHQPLDRGRDRLNEELRGADMARQPHRRTGQGVGQRERSPHASAMTVTSVGHSRTLMLRLRNTRLQLPGSGLTGCHGLAWGS
ncbi:hypothetical protein SDC9_153756 [bioreactor metagenome]|uniref:Uncharacterized protein n=1 Tax=bioreactor metagenome TaxID=1076179 RepID=A0A645EYF3_9ZZZZ